MPRKNQDLREGAEALLGSRLKEIREKKRQMTSAELHRKTGISKSSLTRYEKGDRLPGASELRALCDALEVSPQYLLYGDEAREFGPLSTSVYDLNIESDRQFMLIATVLLQSLSRPDRTAFLQLLLSSVITRIGEETFGELMKILNDVIDDLETQLEPAIVSIVERVATKYEQK